MGTDKPMHKKINSDTVVHMIASRLLFARVLSMRTCASVTHKRKRPGKLCLSILDLSSEILLVKLSLRRNATKCRVTF